MSPFGTVLPRRWPLVPLVGTGPPRTEPLRGVGRSGREGVMAVDRFVGTLWSARMGVRDQGSVVWVKCATSAEYIQSIDSRVLGHGHRFIVGHTIGSRSKCRINQLINYVITKM
ncbi:hypothetical protein VPH35_038356 [Triticum aestivum]